MAVQVGVLGPVCVRVDGVEVDLSRAVHRRLVARLAAAYPGSVSAPTLIDEVWGEEGTSVANLHVALSRLRSALGPVGAEAVVTRNGGYGLRIDPDDLDAVVFANELRRARGVQDPAVARATIEQALGRWRGEPYEDVDLDLAEPESARLRELFLLGVERLATLEIESGEALAAVERLAPVVAAHPLRESLRERLMTALHRLGRRAEALTVFEEGRHAVADQLGVDPSPSLRRLHEAILRDDAEQPPAAERPAAAARPVVADAPVVPAGSEMVGREAELARLRDLSGAGTGPVSVVFVEGEAGIGKSQLVQAFTTGVPADTVVAVGHCWDHAGAPALWPWEQLLTAISRQLPAIVGDGPAAADVLDVLRRSRAPQEGVVGEATTTRASFFADVIALLQRLAQQRPVVLCIEDGQWADRESVALAELVVSTLRDVRLVLVVTLRTEGSAEGGAEAAGDLVALLSRHRFTQHLRLTGLDVDAVARLVQRRTGTAVDSVAAARLHERTEGNPFFVEELVRLYAEEQDRAGHARSSVPSSIRAVIERRLRHLQDADRSLLLTAALSGRSLDVPLVRAASGLDADRVLDGIDRAVASGLVVSDETSGELRFSHMLVQEVLAASLTRPRASASHRRLARALAARPEPDASRVVHHLRHVDDEDVRTETVTWLLRAAQQAERRTALDDAIALCREALDLALLLDDEQSAVLRLESELRLASLLSLTLGYTSTAVADQWRRTLELAQELDSVEHVMAALWGIGLHLSTDVPDGDFGPAMDAVRMIGKAASELDDPRLVALHRLTRGYIGWHLGRFEESHDDFHVAVEVFDRYDDEEILRIFPQHLGVQARSWLAVVSALVQDDPAESDAIAAELRRRTARLGHLFSSVYGDVVLSLRSMWLGRPEETRGLAWPAVEIARDQAVPQLLAWACLPAGWADLMLDDAAAAADLVDEMRRTCREINGNEPFCAWVIQGLQGVATARIGDVDGARQLLAQARALAAQQVIARHDDALAQVEADLPRYPDDLELTREAATLLARRMMTALVGETLPAGVTERLAGSDGSR